MRTTRTFTRSFFRRSIAVALAAAASAMGAAPGLAQPLDTRVPKNGGGMDLHLFRPAIDSKGFFTVNGADILGHKDFSLGLLLDYGHGLVPMSDGHGAKYLVEHAFSGTFQFDIGLANWVVLGLSGPVVLNGGSALTDIGPGGAANYDVKKLTGQALGNLAFHAKLRILRPDGPIGLALIAQAGYGVGGTNNLASEPGFFYWPELVMERRFGTIARIALNAGYRGHTGANAKFGVGKDNKPELRAGELEYSNLLTAGFAVSFRVLPALDLTAETYTTYQLGGSSAAKQKPSAEALGGIKVFIDGNSYLFVGAGFGYTEGFQSAAQRATLGFVFEPSIGDRDNDGISDDQDKCPDDPEDKDGFEDHDGCPDLDNDKDGIPDEQDKCRNDPEDTDNYQDRDGCPEPNDGDKDNDGIMDAFDKCPNDPEDKDGFKDNDGCPDPDNDDDGIPDVNDRCKNDPEDKDGFQDKDGCPDPDNDHDGIPDGNDKCRDEPETRNGFEDDDGCPDKDSRKVVIQDNNILIMDKILFKTSSAEILKQSFPIIDAVAQTLLQHPEFTVVEVQGHADERDDEKRNLKLTQDRAKSVVDALVKKGVSSSRLRAMGYGMYCPVDPGHNEKAWEKNRRVEFKVVRTTDGPTGAVLGCDLSRVKGVFPPPP